MVNILLKVIKILFMSLLAIGLLYLVIRFTIFILETTIVLKIIKYVFLFWLVMTCIYKLISLIIFIIKLLLDNKEIKYYTNLIDSYALDFMSKIGYCILINGKIGSGKTTQQAMLSHYLTIDCYVKVKNEIEDFKEDFPQLDYALLDTEIEKLYKDYTKAMSEDNTIQYHFKNLFEVLESKYCDLFFDNYKDDGVSRTYFYDCFYKYVFCYCRLKSNHYVVSNTKCYSYITNNYALGFDSEMMSLKKMYEKKDLYFDEYLVIVKDENSADSDDYYLNFQESYKDDNGRHLFLRFIRHIFEGTVRFITTDQDAKGMVKNERKILDTYIYCEGLKIICDRPTLTKFIIKLKTFVKSLQNVWAKVFHHKKQEIYLSNNNNFKKIIKLLKKWQSYVHSKAMIIYTDRIYKDEEDCASLRENSEMKKIYDSAKLIGPIQWAFGSIDTHEFHYIYRWFQNQYGHNFWNLSEYKDIVNEADLNKQIAKLLKRKNTKKETTIDYTDLMVDEEGELYGK